jgi:thioredoxin reductase (NADPH)
MSNPAIKLYGVNWCSDCKRTKKFLGEQGIRYEYINIEEDEEGQAFVRGLQHGSMIIPTLVFEDGSFLTEPSNAELATKLGLQSRARYEFYDLIIVGGGATALTTAIYMAPEGFDVLVIERSGLSGQAGLIERLENYPGFPKAVTGAEFATRIVEQATRCGVELLSTQEVVNIESDLDGHIITTNTGHQYRSRAVLLATGSAYKRLGVPGEDALLGMGVYYCATCNGPFYRGREVVVVGGGNRGVAAAVFLTRFCSKVIILERSSSLRCSKLAAEKALSSSRIEVHYNTEVVEFHSEQGDLQSVVVKQNKTGEREELHPAAAFIFIGLVPNSTSFRSLVKLDDYGFVLTGPDFQTSTTGIFAAGDIRSGSTKQLVSAAGEGAAAAIAIREYLRGHDAHAMEAAMRAARQE